MTKSSDRKTEIAKFLKSNYLTEPTSKVLTDRLHKNFPGPKFFDKAQFDLLASISQILMGDEEQNIYHHQVAGLIDERLSQNKGDGWRYDEMPPDREMYLLGLKNLKNFCQELFERNFTHLKEEDKVEILGKIQNGKVSEKWSKDLPPEKFFVELLAEIAENYYSFPEIQLEIGYAGMADHQGWEKIGLNETEKAESLIEEKFQHKKS